MLEHQILIHSLNNVNRVGRYSASSTRDTARQQNLGSIVGRFVQAGTESGHALLISPKLESVGNRVAADRGINALEITLEARHSVQFREHVGVVSVVPFAGLGLEFDFEEFDGGSDVAVDAPGDCPGHKDFAVLAPFAVVENLQAQSVNAEHPHVEQRVAK